eukprot:scaffold22815_cov60-Phaeocystis_antarctica.AAC.8
MADERCDATGPGRSFRLYGIPNSSAAAFSAAAAAVNRRSSSTALAAANFSAAAALAAAALSEITLISDASSSKPSPAIIRSDHRCQPSTESHGQLESHSCRLAERRTSHAIPRPSPGRQATPGWQMTLHACADRPGCPSGFGRARLSRQRREGTLGWSRASPDGTMAPLGHTVSPRCHPPWTGQAWGHHARIRNARQSRRGRAVSCSNRA